MGAPAAVACLKALKRAPVLRPEVRSIHAMSLEVSAAEHSVPVACRR